MDPSVIESKLGVIGVKPYISRTKEFDSFTVRYKKRLHQNKPTAISPDLNIFGLWAYDSAVALAMAAEKARLMNASYQKIDISTNSTDLEAFGVSRSGMKLIQVLSRSRVIGYWTKENGISKELNIRNANAAMKSRSNFASIIWPGDKTSPPKGWVIPTNGKKLRIGVPINDGFTEFVHVTWNPDNSIEVEGYCIDVFDAVMAALPYAVSYEYIPFATPEHKYAGTNNDLAYQVYLGNYDAVAGDVTIVANRSQFVDFTLPFTASGVLMVVPVKDYKSKNAWIFLKPLTWELWLTSFWSFVFMGFLIWILEHRVNKDFRGPPGPQLGMILWFAFSIMVFAHKEKVVSNLARFVLIIWFLVVLILTQSYTASLASMLTVQQLQPAVTDVNELIRNKEYVGYQEGSFVYGLLKRLNFDESRLLPYNSPEQWDELFSKGTGNGGIAAAFEEIPYINVFLAKHCSKYTTVGPTYKTDVFAFVRNSISKRMLFSSQVFPIGSPLVPDVSRAILNITEDSLGLDSFWGLFMIVGITAISACMIHVIRFLHDHWHVIVDTCPDSTILSKIKELLRRFDNRDLSAHTFRKDRNGGDGEAVERAMESHENIQQRPSSFSVASSPTNSPASVVFSDYSEQNISFRREQGSSVETKSGWRCKIIPKAHGSGRGRQEETGTMRDVGTQSTPVLVSSSSPSPAPTPSIEERSIKVIMSEAEGGDSTPVSSEKLKSEAEVTIDFLIVYFMLNESNST
ncbi:UNVERIFIED_CONTAM: Glutamate receptor 2.7 [Sesamum calycinum]|uniref:Glutamate receptor 2.7 n=1 Tax=Sesamum calycinum TaxID=2727403 RepID=A0AAW2LY21_9LAMI